MKAASRVILLTSELTKTIEHLLIHDIAQSPALASCSKNLKSATPALAVADKSPRLFGLCASSDAIEPRGGSVSVQRAF